MEYEEERREFDLMEYWRVIVKRKHVLFVFAGTLVVLIGIYSFAVSPKYRPIATLLIEEDTSKMLNIEDEFGFMAYRSQMRDMVFLNTQITLLKSQSLAERVAMKLDLISRQEFGAGDESEKSIMGKIKDLVKFKWLRSKKNPGDGGEVVRDPYLDITENLQRGIDVSPVRDTKVVRVGYTSKYPVLATEIVNTYAREYIGFYIDKKYQTTQQASDFLGDRIVNLRDDIAVKERELQRYGREKEIVFLTETESAAHDKFSDLTNALTQTQIERYRAQATYQELRDLDVDSIPQSMTDPVIQNIRTEYSNTKSEYDRKSKFYKENYPEMVQLRAKMDSLKEELNRVVDDAESEYKAAMRRENFLKKSVESQKAEVAKLDSNAIYYNSLKTEVENMRKLLNSLEEMQKETQVSAQLKGLNTTNISVIDEAKVPRDPVSPNKKLNLLLALLMGVFGGVGLCFLFEYLDNTVKGPEDVEKLAVLPSLGMIPHLPSDGMRNKRYGQYSIFKETHLYGDEHHRNEEAHPEIKEIELINHLYPKFFISEDYRTVRTSILLSHAESPPKTIAFSSSLPMEGKTVTVANMAVAFSQLGKSVVMIDADLRKPRLHCLFNVKSNKGLTGYLTGKCPLEGIVQKTSVENIWLIPSGPIPPNPAELLESDRMKLLLDGIKKEIDFVLIDTPPVLAVVDSLVISTIVDGIVLIVQPEKTMRKPFLRSVEKLRQSNVKIIGVVYNNSNIQTKQYYDKYYYQH